MVCDIGLEENNYLVLFKNNMEYYTSDIFNDKKYD